MLARLLRKITEDHPSLRDRKRAGSTLTGHVCPNCTLTRLQGRDRVPAEYLGHCRGLLFDMPTDNTDDTKSSIPDIKRIPMQGKVVSKERPRSVYNLY